MFMRVSRDFYSLSLILIALLLFATDVYGADPGLPLKDDSVISDQKAGSVLFYNIYTSSAISPSNEDTRINITNTAAFESAVVYLFFIDGSTCEPAGAVLCLTGNQTVTFKASDLDPDVTGFLIAIATDTYGCPIKFNYLIGDEYVKFDSGHAANLGAEAVSGINVLPCNEADPFCTLEFNDDQYGRLPSVVAVDNIASRIDGNNTLVILNRVSGSLATGVDPIGVISGVLYGDDEDPHSFVINGLQCQLKLKLSNSIPRTAPNFNTIISAGRSGWIKVFAASNAPLLGSVINFNERAGELDGAYNQGRNLYKLRLTNSIFIVPFLMPHC